MVQHADLDHAVIPGAAIVQDDGSTVGTASVLNFTNGTATFSNGTATINLASAAGAANVVIFDEGGNAGTATLGINVVGTYASGTVSGGTAVFTFPLPPGHEFDYAEGTAAVSISATTEGGAGTVVSGNAVTYDGSTAVVIEGVFPVCQFNGSVNDIGTLVLYDGSSSIGRFPAIRAQVTGVTNEHSVSVSRRLTPSAAAHTYSWRAYKNANTFVVGGGTAGSGANLPCFIRITKA